ncbi:succinyl-diaminopimelate desuccinylase [Gammaproteobacteria bacterium]
MSPTLSLAIDLISRPSVTPEDGGCQEVLIQRLESLRFLIERFPQKGVTNFWARHGQEEPLLVFAGHSDVVPPGAMERWSTPPFTPILKDDFLCGRGAADMKGGLAAMLTAVESFVLEHPNHAGSIGFLVTSDEEGTALNGTRYVMEQLEARGEHISACVLGEPTSEDKICDCVKNGRRGSLNGVLKVRGIQGHIAYPHLSKNPIHEAAPALLELIATEWDRGNEHFPPTGFQISNIHAGEGTLNIIPGELTVLFNFRFSTAVTAEALQNRVEAVIQRHCKKYQLSWSSSGDPFLTSEGKLLDVVREAILGVTGYPPRFSTAGGISDGRFIAPTGAQVVEIGPLNATIHQVNERVAIEDLEVLHQVYRRILEEFLAQHN